MIMAQIDESDAQAPSNLYILLPKKKTYIWEGVNLLNGVVTGSQFIFCQQTVMLLLACCCM